MSALLLPALVGTAAVDCEAGLMDPLEKAAGLAFEGDLRFSLPVSFFSWLALYLRRIRSKRTAKTIMAPRIAFEDKT